jgi:hypothetical protein
MIGRQVATTFAITYELLYYIFRPPLKGIQKLLTSLDSRLGEKGERGRIRMWSAGRT